MPEHLVGACQDCDLMIREFHDPHFSETSEYVCPGCRSQRFAVMRVIDDFELPPPITVMKSTNASEDEPAMEWTRIGIADGVLYKDGEEFGRILPAEADEPTIVEREPQSDEPPLDKTPARE
jgi:hypothetical protein